MVTIRSVVVPHNHSRHAVRSAIVMDVMDCGRHSVGGLHRSDTFISPCILPLVCKIDDDDTFTSLYLCKALAHAQQIAHFGSLQYKPPKRCCNVVLLWHSVRQCDGSIWLSNNLHHYHWVFYCIKVVRMLS